MIGTKQIALVVGFLAFTGGVFAFGYHKGSVNEIQKSEAKRVATQEQLFDLADTVREQTAELRRLQQEKEELVHVLENEATSAAGSDGSGISSTGGLLRLERRWGTNSGTPNGGN